jgi:hypothetical protein
VNEVDQPADEVRIALRQDAVAQVEDVTGPPAGSP